MASSPPDRLVVSDDQTTPTLGAALRYLIAAFGSFALGKGWVNGDTLQALTAAITVLAPAVYGVWLAYKNKGKLITTAAAAPNSVAVVK